MDIKEYNQKMSDLKANLTDEGKATGIMAELLEDYKDIQNELASTKLINEDLKNKNASLQDTNCKLFLKVNSDKPIDDAQEHEKKIPELKFENGKLFG